MWQCCRWIPITMSTLDMVETWSSACRACCMAMKELVIVENQWCNCFGGHCFVPGWVPSTDCSWSLHALTSTTRSSTWEQLLETQSLTGWCWSVDDLLRDHTIQASRLSMVAFSWCSWSLLEITPSRWKFATRSEAISEWRCVHGAMQALAAMFLLKILVYVRLGARPFSNQFLGAETCSHPCFWCLAVTTLDSWSGIFCIWSHMVVLEIFVPALPVCSVVPWGCSVLSLALERGRSDA